MATLAHDPQPHGRMLFERRRVVASLLSLDPDLADGMAAERQATAARLVRVEVLSVSKGDREPPRAAAGDLGLLVASGMLARLVRVGRRESLELLGPGDLVRPDREEDAGLVEHEVTWEALTPVTFAVLDARLARALQAWPELQAALMDRTLRRARWLTLQAAIAAHHLIEERLILLLCHIGERAGRMTPEGIVFELPLSHRLIARAVRALRPSVTSGLLRLRADGHLRCGPGQRWTITPSGLDLAARLAAGDPPDA